MVPRKPLFFQLYCFTTIPRRSAYRLSTIPEWSAYLGVMDGLFSLGYDDDHRLFLLVFSLAFGCVHTPLGRQMRFVMGPRVSLGEMMFVKIDCCIISSSRSGRRKWWWMYWLCTKKYRKDLILAWFCFRHFAYAELILSSVSSSAHLFLCVLISPACARTK